MVISIWTKLKPTSLLKPAAALRIIKRQGLLFAEIIKSLAKTATFRALSLNKGHQFIFIGTVLMGERKSHFNQIRQLLALRVCVRGIEYLCMFFAEFVVEGAAQGVIVQHLDLGLTARSFDDFGDAITHQLIPAPEVRLIARPFRAIAGEAQACRFCGSSRGTSRPLRRTFPFLSAFARGTM